MEFKPVEANEQACSYDVDCFVMFYGNILEQLMVGPRFMNFQASILNLLGLCPTQLTWNTWAFILCFKVVSLYLEVEPSPKFFLFFFSHASPKMGLDAFSSMVRLDYIKEYEDQCKVVEEFIHQGLPSKGYHSFFLDECHRPHYPLKWSPSMRHEDWSFDSLLPDD